MEADSPLENDIIGELRNNTPLRAANIPLFKFTNKKSSEAFRTLDLCSESQCLIVNNSELAYVYINRFTHVVAFEVLHDETSKQLTVLCKQAGVLFARFDGYTAAEALQRHLDDTEPDPTLLIVSSSVSQHNDLLELCEVDLKYELFERDCSITHDDFTFLIDESTALILFDTGKLNK